MLGEAAGCLSPACKGVLAIGRQDEKQQDVVGRRTATQTQQQQQNQHLDPDWQSWTCAV
jgi:hypothetical protein